MSEIEAQIHDRVRWDMGRVRAELETLVRIPSVSHPGHDLAHPRRSAEETARILSQAGVSARLLEVDGAPPAVLGRVPAPDKRPTVLLYAHHDVQPTGPPDLWHSAPFEPTERDGRLYGRGTADDKCGVVIHAAAMRAWAGRPPVGVTIFIEGEEEWGSPHLATFLERYAMDLRADVVVLADSAMWRVGHPALTVSLRGHVVAEIGVRTLDHAVHSGAFGGPVPDALVVLVRILAALHDEDGSVAVAGIATRPADPLDLTEGELRVQAGVRPSVRLIGEGGLTERMWTKPSISILGIDAPRIQGSTNQLVPSAAARISMRVPPGNNMAGAMRSLVSHVRSSVPWGAEVTVTQQIRGEPFEADTSGPAYSAMVRAMGTAWGRPPVMIGIGATIPFVSQFAMAFPKASLILTGVGDPTSNAHSEDESVDLCELERSCIAEALFLGYLGGDAICD